MNDANQNACDRISTHRAFRSCPTCVRAAIALIALCDRAGYVVHLMEARQSSFTCDRCRRSTFVGSSICWDCDTLWINPPSLGTGPPSPAEIVVSLAHEVGHMVDPPRPEDQQLTRGTSEWLTREREREHSAWDFAERHLRADPAAWEELGSVFTAVRAHRLAQYGKRWAAIS